MVVDEYLVEQEKVIDALYDPDGHFAKMSEAEVNYESMLSVEIVKAKEIHGSTLAKDIAKGSDAVIQVKKDWLEAERKVKKSQAKITFIQNCYEADKLRTRINMKVDH